MGPRKSQRTIQPRPTQFPMKDIMMQVVPFQSFEIMGGKGGEGEGGNDSFKLYLRKCMQKNQTTKKEKRIRNVQN